MCADRGGGEVWLEPGPKPTSGTGTGRPAQEKAGWGRGCLSEVSLEQGGAAGKL